MDTSDKKGKPVLVVPSGVTGDEYEMGDLMPVMTEFDVQKTAETEELLPGIAQGIPVSGFKDITKEDLTR